MTRSLRFYTLDVFTERRFGGNPLAVFTDGADLTGDAPELIRSGKGSLTPFGIAHG